MPGKCGAERKGSSALGWRLRRRSGLRRRSVRSAAALRNGVAVARLNRCTLKSLNPSGACETAVSLLAGEEVLHLRFTQKPMNTPPALHWFNDHVLTV